MPSETAAIDEEPGFPRRKPAQDFGDSHVLKNIRAGDDRGFETLVSAHASRVINLAYRLVGNREDAEEIAQEAFLRLHRNLESFRGDSSLGTWMYRTVTRLAIDHLRREKLKRRIFFFRKASDDPDPVETASDPGRDQGQQLLDKELERRLQSALEKLSPRQRSVFVLRHQEGVALKEIAGILNLGEATVKAHLHRAVTFLREELKDLKKDQS